MTFIDSDDKADIDLIQKLVDGICEFDCDTCIGGFKRILENIQFVLRKDTINTIRGKDVYDKLFARMLGSAPDNMML